MAVEVIYLRTLAPLKAQLREAAKANGRTLNAEIVWRLRRSLEGYRQ